MPLTNRQRSIVFATAASYGSWRVTVRRLARYRSVSSGVRPWAGLKNARRTSIPWSLTPWRRTSTVPGSSSCFARRSANWVRAPSAPPWTATRRSHAFGCVSATKSKSSAMSRPRAVEVGGPLGLRPPLADSIPAGLDQRDRDRVLEPALVGLHSFAASYVTDSSWTCGGSGSRRKRRPCCDCTVPKWRRSRVTMRSVPRRSARTIVAASVVPSRRSA